MKEILQEIFQEMSTIDQTDFILGLDKDLCRTTIHKLIKLLEKKDRLIKKLSKDAQPVQEPQPEEEVFDVTNEILKYKPSGKTSELTKSRVIDYIKHGMTCEEARKKAHNDQVRDCQSKMIRVREKGKRILGFTKLKNWKSQRKRLWLIVCTVKNH